MMISTDKIRVEMSQKELKYFKLFNSDAIKSFLRKLLPEEDIENDNKRRIGFRVDND